MCLHWYTLWQWLILDLLNSKRGFPLFSLLDILQYPVSNCLHCIRCAGKFLSHLLHFILILPSFTNSCRLESKSVLVSELPRDCHTPLYLSVISQTFIVIFNYFRRLITLLDGIPTCPDLTKWPMQVGMAYSNLMISPASYILGIQNENHLFYIFFQTNIFLSLKTFSLFCHFNWFSISSWTVTKIDLILSSSNNVIVFF